MMSRKGNRFGIEPVEIPSSSSARRAREPGPMGAAVRESAAGVQEASEGLVEQRRQNAADAKAFRKARDEGRVLVTLPVAEVATTALPRDRLDLDAVSASDEMAELKASIRERGQREAIEVFEDEAGAWQLKAGWRRLCALRQLHQETGDERFGVVLARVTTHATDRAELYVDMVEENVIRQDLSFAEMAQIALKLAADDDAQIGSADEAVARLYRSFQRNKRYFIRAFVTLMEEVGDALPFPRELSRDLGLAVSQRLSEADASDVARLKQRLRSAADAGEQTAVLRAFADHRPKPTGAVERKSSPKEKFEFRVGDTKVTARSGELRIRADVDFTSVDKVALERAIKAFEASLTKSSD